jgi:hypothetical protein
VSKGLEVPDEFLKAFGLEGLAPTPEPAIPPASVPFTSLAGCERAIELTFAGLDLEALVRQEGFARARGVV